MARILLVEDDDMIREMVQMTLELDDHQGVPGRSVEDLPSL